MRGPPGTSLYSGYPLATIRITPPIKNASPDVQFLAQYANALAFQYAFHNRQPKLRRKNTVCCHSNLPFAAVCPYFPCLKIGVHLTSSRVLCATVRDFSAVTMQLNPGKGLETNKRDSGN